jgi:hypothetical protein
VSHPIIECVVGDVVVASRVGTADSILSDYVLNDGAIGRTDRVHDEAAWCLAGNETCRSREAECNEVEEYKEHCA